MGNKYKYDSGSHKLKQLIWYNNITKYFRLEIVSVTEFPETRLLQVTVRVIIDMDSEGAGDAMERCLKRQDK